MTSNPTYLVIADDGTQYGPITESDLRVWIQERRVQGHNQALLEGSAEWKPLADHPPFCRLFAPPPPPPRPGGAAPRAAFGARAPAAAKTSRLAVTSLILGVLGFLGITGLLGLILGIVGLVKIRNSGGSLKGGGLAVTGICLSVVMLLLPVLVLRSALTQSKEIARRINCSNQLRQLSLGVRTHAIDDDEKLPSADSWCDVLKREGTAPGIFKCPAHQGGLCSYALNKNLIGIKNWQDDPLAVLFFESNGSWNAVGDEADVAKTRHGNSINVAFVDGSVLLIKLDSPEYRNLHWKPEIKASEPPAPERRAAPAVSSQAETTRRPAAAREPTRQDFNTREKSIKRNGNGLVAVQKIQIGVAKVVEKTSIEEVTKNPYAALGKVCEFTGEAFKIEAAAPNPVMKGSWTEVLVLVPNDNSPQGATTVDFICRGDASAVNSGDKVAFSGYFIGTYESPNEVGGTLECLALVGDSLQTASAKRPGARTR